MYKVVVATHNRLAIERMQFHDNGVAELTQVECWGSVGARITRVQFDTLKPPTDADLPAGTRRGRKIFEGKIGVLKQMETVGNPKETARMIEEVFDGLNQKRIKESMVLAALKENYPDMVDCDKYSSWTGRELSLEQRVKKMKKKSYMYKGTKKLLKELKHMGIV